MAQGKVGVSAQNTGSGALKEVERTALFIGVGTANIATVIPITAQSEFTELFGEGDLTEQLTAWRNNGDDLVSGYAVAINSGDDIHAAIDSAIDQGVEPELIAICPHVNGKAQVEEYQAKAAELLAKHANYVRILVAAPGITSDQSWPDYIAALQPITDGIVADRVAVVPQVHGDELGAVLGRLCKCSVTIADSPMRTQTGAILLKPKPQDKNGAVLTNATTGALDKLRFSCAQWYTNFDGTYFGDVNLLDAEGGDFKKIEDGRIVDMAARKVRIKAIYQIKNRRFNNSPTGIAYAKGELTEPLRDMSTSIKIGEDVFPGLIKPPTADAIGLTFLNESQVQVMMKVTPYDSPNTILVGITLDRN